MPRLIDADKAYKVLTDYYHQRTEIQHEALKEALSKVPTVDTEPVVRCKDCKDWSTWNDPTKTQSNFCPILDYWTKGEFYCAYGERKEDETD